MNTKTVCPDCNGKGTIALLTSTVPCTRCAGSNAYVPGETRGEARDVLDDYNRSGYWTRQELIDAEDEDAKIGESSAKSGRTAETVPYQVTMDGDGQVRVAIAVGAVTVKVRLDVLDDIVRCAGEIKKGLSPAADWWAATKRAGTPSDPDSPGA